MSELDELRHRVDALEGEVERLREENAATRTLASMADRDVAEMRTSLRAHTQTLNALRETQLEQGRAVQGIAEAVGGLIAGQAALADAVAGLTAGQAEMLEQLRRLTGDRDRHDDGGKP